MGRLKVESVEKVKDFYPADRNNRYNLKNHLQATTARRKLAKKKVCR